MISLPDSLSQQGLDKMGNSEKEVGDGGGGMMEVEDDDVEVLTAASNMVITLAHPGVKVDAVIKNLKEFKRGVLVKERSGTDKEKAELTRLLQVKDVALERMRKNYSLEMDRRIAAEMKLRRVNLSGESRREMQPPPLVVVAFGSGGVDLQNGSGVEDTTEKLVRGTHSKTDAERVREYWESSGTDSESDSDDDSDSGSRPSQTLPPPPTKPAPLDSSEDEVEEEEVDVEELPGPSHNVRPIVQKQGSNCKEGQSTPRSKTLKKVENESDPDPVPHFRKRKKAPVRLPERRSLRILPATPKGQRRVAAKHSKLAGFQAKLPSKSKRAVHQRKCPSQMGPETRNSKRNQNYVCSTCTRAFSNRADLSRHTQTKHSGNRPFQCPKCPSRFKLKYNLTAHMAVHASQKQFKCSQCPARFRHRCAVRRHILSVHSTRKPFNCQVCGTSFTVKSDLTKHHRVHTGERPYSCPTCGKSFTQSGSLTTHVRTHLGEEGKTHQCPFCSIKFVTNSNCLAHQRRHHGTELAGAPLSGR